jgi:outer membrane receptor protein involved in Fe transport
VTWASPWDVDFSLGWRFIGAVTNNKNASNPALGSGPGTDTHADGHIPLFNYIDLSAVWHYSNGIEFRGGVNNVFATEPPALSSAATPLQAFGNANTFPGTYDFLGRQLYIAATFKD